MQSLQQSTGMTTEGILQNASGWRAGCVDIPAFEGGAWGGRSDKISHCAQPRQWLTCELWRMCGANNLARLCEVGLPNMPERLWSEISMKLRARNQRGYDNEKVLKAIQQVELDQSLADYQYSTFHRNQQIREGCLC